MKAALDILQQGGTLLYPTDTVWGLGCDALNEEAVAKISKIKGRPAEKPFILLVASEKQLQDLVEVPAMAWEIMDLSEKPVTIVYEKSEALPDFLKHTDGSIAIRLVKDIFCRNLITKLKNPLLSTSANFSGAPTPKSFAEIDPKIIAMADFVIDPSIQPAANGQTSSVIQIWQDGRIKVLRE